MIHTENIHRKNRQKVAVAMSGGIDSSMAAKILKDEGWELIGVTIKFLPHKLNRKNPSAACFPLGDIDTAKKVCLKLNIPHTVIDLTRQFEKKIINPFCIEYQKGNTPNPCVECNKYIKFGVLLEKIKNLGAVFLATGHYCRIGKSQHTDLFEIKKGFDNIKDQSYVLWKLSQNQILKIKTPVGIFSKHEIRKRVNKIFPFLEEKSESQDICFISDNDYHSFLKQRFKNIKEGDIINISGKLIGKHKGYPLYTIGQRKGLGISHSKPLYVKEIIPEKNIIVAGEEKDIQQDLLKIKDINFIAGSPPSKQFKATVKIRYNSKETPAEIKLNDHKTGSIFFEKQQKAVTPGQSAVFYAGDILIGGGIISKF